MELTRILLPEIFDGIILGRNVKRSMHELSYDGESQTALFIERLQINRFWPVSVEQIAVSPGYRVPAFYIDDESALFGYVFWEIFSRGKMRKLWGSAIRNEKGDWKYIIPDKWEST